MTILKWGLVILPLGLILIGLIPVVVTEVEKSQARANQQRLVEPLPNSTKPVAVVVFSRSGNTAVLGRHIAEREGGDFFRLEAMDYELGLMGWVRAMLDAREGEAVITPATIDLSGYDRVYLGSPIWLYSPAPPIWQFVQTNRFDGQEVTLFNTYNSEFGQNYIDEIGLQIKEKGAKSFTHKAIRRGRMGQQLGVEQMLEEFDQL